MRSTTITLFALVLSVIPLQSAYGHGLGMDTVKATGIDGRDISITVQIIPTEFTPDSKKSITVRLADSETKQNVDAVILLSIYHKNALLIEDGFVASDGIVEINVKQTDEIAPKVVGQYDDALGAWVSTDAEPIELVGPVFDSGGLYHFEIIPKMADGATIENPKTYVADVTMTTEQVYYESDSDGKSVVFGVKSYYDETSSFDYEPVTNTVAFEMPFDWSEKNISHIPVVHEEVHFPKNFAGFVVPSYVGKVNGVELFKSSVTIDDYSDENDRIVHFVLSQDNLRYLKQAQKAAGVENPQSLRFSLETSQDVVFPAIALTKSEEIQVDLTWDPATIEPEKNTKFIYTFRDARTGEPLRNTSYELVLLQNGAEVYRKSGMAQIGGDYTDYTFSKEETGYTSIRFENIRETGQSTEFVVTVVPEFGPLALVILSVSVMATVIIGRGSVFRI